MRSRLLVNALYLLVGCASLPAGALTLEQQHGREIFRRGKLSGSAAGVAAVGADGMKLPASSFACAGCHGIWGEGTREGGIEAPPLSWPRLTSPATSTVTGRRRGPYTAATLRQAIGPGFDPAGKRLHPGMPRYEMPAEQLSELISYLERIGDTDDMDTGVSAQSIRIGVALPLSGPLAAAGESIRETLDLLFQAETRSGGIFGRKIELVVEDSRGDPAGLLEATRCLIERDSVFALAASFEPTGSEDTNQLLESAGIPLIGPIAVSPRQKDLPNPYLFYFLPTLYDQARALVEFISVRETSRRPRLAMIHAGTAQHEDVTEGVRRQAAALGLEIVGEEGDSPQGVSAIVSKRPDYVVFSGDGEGLARVARQLDAPDAPVLASFVSTTRSGIDFLPRTVSSRALLAAPSFPPDTRGAEAFFALLQAGNFPPTFPGLRMAAFAAGTVLVQALRTSGNRLSRDLLVRTLEHLQHFETGTTAPLTFGPNQRVGSAGAVVLSFQSESGTFVPAGGWVSPAN